MLVGQLRSHVSIVLDNTNHIQIMRECVAQDVQRSRDIWLSNNWSLWINGHRDLIQTESLLGTRNHQGTSNKLRPRDKGIRNHMSECHGAEVHLFPRPSSRVHQLPSPLSSFLRETAWSGVEDNVSGTRFCFVCFVVFCFVFSLLLLLMVLLVVLEFENGSREEELLLFFLVAAWQFLEGWCCARGAQGDKI